MLTGRVCGFRSFEVADGGAEQFGAVAEHADASVAATAEQPAHGSRLVVVIDGESSEPDFSDATALYGGDAAWTFAEFGEAIYSGDWQDLLSAPELKAIEPIKALNTAGKTSKENADKLVGAARIILRRAGGAMRDQVLAYALVTLFELDAPDMFLMRDDDVQEKPGKIADSPEGRVEAIEAADDIIMQLSPNQCMALIVLDQPIAMARASLPPIPNLESFLEDLRARMREILDPTDLPPGAMDYVLRHARKLRDQVEI